MMTNTAKNYEQVNNAYSVMVAGTAQTGRTEPTLKHDKICLIQSNTDCRGRVDYSLPQLNHSSLKQCLLILLLYESLTSCLGEARERLTT